MQLGDQVREIYTGKVGRLTMLASNGQCQVDFGQGDCSRFVENIEKVND